MKRQQPTQPTPSPATQEQPTVEDLLEKLRQLDDDQLKGVTGGRDKCGSGQCMKCRLS